MHILKCFNIKKEWRSSMIYCYFQLCFEDLILFYLQCSSLLLLAWLRCLHNWVLVTNCILCDLELNWEWVSRLPLNWIVCSGISQVGQFSCELKSQASRMHLFKMESIKSTYFIWFTVACTPFLSFNMMPSLNSLRSEVNGSFKVKLHKGIAVSALLMYCTLF